MTISVDPLSGVLGHLTPHQRTQFDAFRTALVAADLYRPGPPPSHDDATLLRFLRARKFDPHKAREQFAATERWRADNAVDALYATFPTDEMQRAKFFYPRWTGRRDKHGVPVYVYRLASINAAMQRELHATPERRRYERIVALWEFMRRFTLPLCSALPHTPAPQPASPVLSSSPSALSNGDTPLSPNGATHPSPPSSSQHPITSVFSIIDLAGVSLGTMWSLRHHLQQASELATAHYPETLHRIAVVNAPSFFGTVWGWIRAWFDEGTRDKVHVLDSNPGPTLLSYIDAANLPKVYGGELEFAYEDEPALDDDARAALGRDEIPAGPVVFEDGKGWSRPEGWQAETVNGVASSEAESEHAKPAHKRRWFNFSSSEN